MNGIQNDELIQQFIAEYKLYKQEKETQLEKMQEKIFQQDNLLQSEKNINKKLLHENEQLKQANADFLNEIESCKEKLKIQYKQILELAQNNNNKTQPKKEDQSNLQQLISQNQNLENKLAQLNQQYETNQQHWLSNIQKLESDRVSLVNINTSQAKELQVSFSQIQQNEEITAQLEQENQKLKEQLLTLNKAQQDALQNRTWHYENQENINQNEPKQQNKLGRNNKNEQKIISEMCDIFGLDSPVNLIPTVQKMEQAIKMIPKLQQLMTKIVEIVLPTIHQQTGDSSFENLIPTLQKWAQQSQHLANYTEFIEELIDLLEINPSNNDYLTILETIKTYKLLNDQYEKEKNLLLQEKERHLKFIEETMQILQLSDANDISAMGEQIEILISEYNQTQNFLSIAKNLLELNPQFQSEDVYRAIVRMFEVMREMKFNQDTELIDQLKILSQN